VKKLKFSITKFLNLVSKLQWNLFRNKYRINIDGFIERCNYFSHPKEVVREIYHAIRDPDKNRKVLESLGMSESTYDFSLLKKLFKNKVFKK